MHYDGYFLVLKRPDPYMTRHPPEAEDLFQSEAYAVARVYEGSPRQVGRELRITG